MSLSNINSLLSYLPELILVLSILCVFLMESFSKYRSLTFVATVIGLLVTAVFLFFTNSVDIALFNGMIV